MKPPFPFLYNPLKSLFCSFNKTERSLFCQEKLAFGLTVKVNGFDLEERGDNGRTTVPELYLKTVAEILHLQGKTDLGLALA